MNHSSTLYCIYNMIAMYVWYNDNNRPEDHFGARCKIIISFPEAKHRL